MHRSGSDRRFDGDGKRLDLDRTYWACGALLRPGVVCRGLFDGIRAERHTASGLPGDGSYVMSSEQQALGCRELQARQVGLQERMQQLPEKAVQEMQALPQTVAGAWARLIGSDKGAPSPSTTR